MQVSANSSEQMRGENLLLRRQQLVPKDARWTMTLEEGLKQGEGLEVPQRSTPGGQLSGEQLQERQVCD